MRDIIKENLKYILSALIIIPIVALLLNIQNLRYLYGNVPVSFNDTYSAVNFLSTNENYGNIQNNAEGSETVYITQSTDSSTNVRIISKGSTIEEIDMDLDTSDFSQSDFHKNLLNNLEPVLTAATTNYKAIEVWALSNGLRSQSVEDQKNFSISRNFGHISIYAANDAASKTINIKIEQNNK